MNAWVWQPTNSSGHTVTHPYWLWLLGHQVSPLNSLIAHQGSRRGHDKLMPASCFFLGSREACIPWYVYQADNQWPQFVYCSTTSNVPVLFWCSVWLVSTLLWDPQLTQVCSLLQRWDMVTLAWQSTITTIKKVKWCFSSRLMWFGLIAWSDAGLLAVTIEVDTWAGVSKGGSLWGQSLILWPKPRHLWHFPLKGFGCVLVPPPDCCWAPSGFELVLLNSLSPAEWSTNWAQDPFDAGLRVVCLILQQS